MDNSLIKRQAAIDAICTEGTRLERNGTVAMAEIKQWCVDILDALPSAQPEQKKGKWIHNTDPMAGEGYWNCSVCGYDVYDCSEYCPNCGSYNGGEQE